MANYNVDDILAEIQRTKDKEAPPAQASAAGAAQSEKTAAGGSAPFLMTGMTAEFTPPTRTQNPETGSAAAANDRSATRVIPAVTPDEEDFSLRRQDKVSKFMQNSFDLDDEDDEDSFDLSSFFGEKRSSAHLGITKTDGYDDLDLEEDDAPVRTKKHRAARKAAEPAAPKKHFGAKHPASDFEDEEEPPKKRFGAKHPASDFEDEEETGGKRFSLFHGRKNAHEDEDDAADSRAQFSDSPEDLPEDAHEYRSTSDAPSVIDELDSLGQSLRLRLIVSGVCLAVSLYLSFCNLYPIPLLDPICPENNMTLYLVCCLVPLLVSAVVSYPVLGNGIIALFSGRAGHDTPAAICVLAVLAHTVALIAGGSLAVGSGSFYPTIAVMTLFANTVGKSMMVARIRRNFAVASADSGHIAEFMLHDNAIADRLMEGQGFQEAAVVCPVKAAFPERFLTLSYSPDDSDLLCRIASPLLLAFGAVSSLLAWFIFKQGATGGLTVFCVMMCMSSALTETLVGNLPLWRAARALSGEGAFVAGYASVEEFEDMNGVAVDANELYPAGAAVLHGIKAFNEGMIDAAILDAASIMSATDGVLKDVFLDTIGNKTQLLKPVSNVVCEDGQGLSAVVEGRTVLIGSRALLERHGVKLPSTDYEAKFKNNNRDILYLARNNEAIAMFILSYRVSRSVSHWLSILAKKDLSLIVHTTDPNITAARIAKDYGYPETHLRIVPADLSPAYLKATAPRDAAPAYAMTLEGSRTRLRLVAALHTLRGSVRLGTILQVAGLVFGYALVAFLAFFGSIGAMGFAQLMLYQLFWTVAIVATTSIHRF
jgi:hypothetical protein